MLPLLHFQIKYSANLYPSWKCLIAWEARRHFSLQYIQKWALWWMCERLLLSVLGLLSPFQCKKNPLMHEAGLWMNPDYIRRQVRRLTKQSAKNIIMLSDTTELQPLILCHADAVWLSFPIKCRNLISLSHVLIYISILWLIHHHHHHHQNFFQVIYSCNNHSVGLGKRHCNLIRFGIKAWQAFTCSYFGMLLTSWNKTTCPGDTHMHASF